MQQVPSVRVVNATEAKNRFGELIKHAYQDAEHLIIQRAGIPVVAILSMPEYERLMEQQETAQSSTTPALVPLIGISKAELLALAQVVVKPERQHQLSEALTANREVGMSDQERTSLDSVLDQLLDEVDQVALLKARALYTLKLQQPTL